MWVKSETLCVQMYAHHPPFQKKVKKNAEKLSYPLCPAHLQPCKVCLCNIVAFMADFTATQLPVTPGIAPPAIYQGDTYYGSTYNIVDPRFDWDALGITEVRMQIRNSAGAPVLVNKTLTFDIDPEAVPDPYHLRVYMRLTKEETSVIPAGTPQFDIEILLDNGERITYIRGPVTVRDQITRTDA